MLAMEITSRYYYQRGRIENSLANDPDVLKAIEVIEDKALYASVLNGTYKPVIVDNEEDIIDESSEEEEEEND